MKITKSQLTKIIKEELALVKEEDGPFGDRTYDHSLVSDVSKTIQWDISQAFNFVLDLLEDVNAHTEYKAVQKVLWDSLEDANPVQEDASLPSGGVYEPVEEELIEAVHMAWGRAAEMGMEDSEIWAAIETEFGRGR